MTQIYSSNELYKSFQRRNVDYLISAQPSCEKLPRVMRTNNTLNLVDVDGDVDGDVDQVSQGQAGNQSVGSVPHALVLADDPQQRGVSNDPHSKDHTGDHRVDVLEGRVY